MSKELLRQIKPVDYLLELPKIQNLIGQSSREFVRDCLRQVLDDLRKRILVGALSESANLEELIEDELQQLCQRRLRPNLRAVINATGTLLHTNLGRAPLAESAIEAIEQAARGYSNLEYDLASGKRGYRDIHCEELLRSLLGCEASVIVNNNAAAVMLVLDELARSGEAIISRGELIEIGGAFRIPDVMEKSGAVLREVGTTNRTRLSDYQQAINEQTRVILRVHPSNYRIIGFTEKPALEDLVALATKHQIPLVEDLGSGCLVDISSSGVKDEPTAQASIAAGVPVITFSGDKMLGGPQAGIIAGQARYIDRIKRNPLMRALRVDKLCYAALGATLQLYQTNQAWQQVPLLNALKATSAEIQTRAKKLLRRVDNAINGQQQLQFTLRAGTSLMGGGSAPEHPLPTTLIAITSPELSASAMEVILRQQDPPVIARIEMDQLIIDLRSVLPHDEPALIRALVELAKART